jgi:NADPH2:quinone reductase
MKEVQVEAHGGPEQLKLHDSPSQAPGPNHVLVRLSAAGVNFMDTGVRRGIFWADKTPPFVPGVEGAGRVMAAMLMQITVKETLERLHRLRCN